jgi:hypothetical protein
LGACGIAPAVDINDLQAIAEQEKAKRKPVPRLLLHGGRREGTER